MTPTPPIAAVPAQPDALDAFDQAVKHELQCVSTVPYSSKEICTWFAANVRERLAVQLSALTQGAAERAVTAIADALRFTKRPVTIEAIQWTGKNYREIIKFAERATCHLDTETVSLPTLEGFMTASKGDWIIRGVNGEYYPCKPDIFEAAYSPAAQVAALTAAQPEPLKDHQIAALVNELRDIAVQYHGTQQLRERIAHVVVPALRAEASQGAAERAVPAGDDVAVPREKLRAWRQWCAQSMSHAIEHEITDCLAAAPATPAPQPFQQRVQPWMMECFGPVIAADRVERNHRFLEESLELVQSLGCTASEAHQLVDYVFGRPVGEPAQEVGGVMVTLAALCLASDLDMHDAGEVELARISEPGIVAKIRAKQAAKPKHSPLPEHPATSQQESNMAAPAQDGERPISAKQIAFTEALASPTGTDPDAWVRFWLDGALRCEAFEWDPEQREMAEAQLLAAINRAARAPVAAAGGVPSDAQIIAAFRAYNDRPNATLSCGATAARWKRALVAAFAAAPQPAPAATADALIRGLLEVADGAPDRGAIAAARAYLIAALAAQQKDTP